MKERTLIERLKAEDPKAQKWLYDHYAPIFYAVCRRYLSCREDAEEALLSGFYKIFSQIDTFQGSGSFEGWMRRVMVNEALMLLRKTQPLVFLGEEVRPPDMQDDFSIEAELSTREILDLLAELPPGYRTVFNLYVLEGYKHHEIAEMLGISINTSKTQLLLARTRLQQLLQARGIYRR
ncbi:MAG: sigma-70 family RNA polymerase sigma factor [Saprospiraceae bacterium]|nr:sigma-70 family RNA polymerase sigma factor [Saprospiraceae bacterium]MDW8483771.1 sigma-70 family RNA polymerase sigma factor [Saprospiraceae bacterium]